MRALLASLLFGLARLLVGAHPIWQGCGPERRQRIYFANHTSHLDTAVIMAALPGELRPFTHPVAAKDYWDRSAFRRFLAVDCLGAVLVDRVPRPGADPLGPLAAVLERGELLVIFPEGTRGASETIAAFKPGIFHLARRFPAAELVPVYLENLWRVLPKGTFLPVPLVCTLRFGTPLAFARGLGKAEFLARAHHALAALAGHEPSEASHAG